MIDIIPASAVQSLASVIEPMIAPAVALTSGRMTTADIVEFAHSGRAQIWLASDGGDLLGGVVARPIEYPGRKALCVMLIAGKQRERWQDQMSDALDDAARHIGCDLIEGIGRHGWARALTGYRLTGSSYEKDLR